MVTCAANADAIGLTFERGTNTAAAGFSEDVESMIVLLPPHSRVLDSSNSSAKQPTVKPRITNAFITLRLSADVDMYMM